ncbi:ANK3, partial [Symbiodinium sp. CCMP2456]
MPQQPEAQYLYELTAVPAGWSLATVIDAFLNLARYEPGYARLERALEALSHRLEELWASQPTEAEAWLQRCRESFATELADKEPRPEELKEALLRHGAAEYGKCGFYGWSFEAGLLRGAPSGSAAAREAGYLHLPQIRDRCRELAERLAEAESPETARKRQKLEEETSERRRLEAELQKPQEEECRDLRDRLATAEAEVSSKTVELQAAQIESAKCKERCDELAARATGAESAAAEMRQELGQLREEHGKCQERCQELANRLEAEASEHGKTKELLAKAESHAAEQQSEVQRLQQDASRGSQDGVQLATGSSKAVLQDRCEQLQQQLAEARGQLEVLWEERGMYKERLRHLAETNTQASYHHPSLHPRGPAAHDAAFGGEEPDLAEQLGYSLVNED